MAESAPESLSAWMKAGSFQLEKVIFSIGETLAASNNCPTDGIVGPKPLGVLFGRQHWRAELTGGAEQDPGGAL